jgi:hypothetical protein
MEPEGLLLHIQEPSTGLYSEPDQSSTQLPNLSLQDTSQYYPTAYILVVLVVSFPLA